MLRNLLSPLASSSTMAANAVQYVQNAQTQTETIDASALHHTLIVNATADGEDSLLNATPEALEKILEASCATNAKPANAAAMEQRQSNASADATATTRSLRDRKSRHSAVEKPKTKTVEQERRLSKRRAKNAEHDVIETAPPLPSQSSTSQMLIVVSDSELPALEKAPRRFLESAERSTLTAAERLDMKAKLETAQRIVSEHARAIAFLKPVSDKDVEGYSRVVKRLVVLSYFLAFYGSPLDHSTWRRSAI